MNDQPPKANNGGLGGLLSTLASSGDNTVRLGILALILINTVMTKCNGVGIKDNNQQIDKLRVVASKQIKSIYDNQHFLFDFVDEVRVSQDKIQTKLGIEHRPVTPYPRSEIPDEYLYPYPSGHNN